MLVFDERGKPEHPKKNLSVQRRELTNSGPIDGRCVPSPLPNPCTLKEGIMLEVTERSLREHLFFWPLFHLPRKIKEPVRYFIDVYFMKRKLFVKDVQ